MAYRLLADAVMTLHFGFIGYVVLGGFLAWRWPWALPPHLLAVGWGATTVAFPATVICPLTEWEDRARRAAGEQGLPASGFIDHYLENVVYPERYTALLQGLAAVVVLTSWLGAGIRARRRRATAGSRNETGGSGQGSPDAAGDRPAAAPDATASRAAAAPEGPASRDADGGPDR